MSIVREIKEFAVKGNVVDMAVGLIVGAGFGKVVSSAVQDVIMPPIGLLLGGVDFKDLKIVLKEAVAGSPAVSLNYGAFLQTIIDFAIIAFAVFMLVKAVNMLRRPAPIEAAPIQKPAQEQLLEEIRDILKKS